ncbi:MAG TPA: ATP-binding cassette domain-containing protein [Polyangiales bacterium]|nr:ATP-binding cassette domain-containing protein [Polyangiales bacterium]
MSGSDKDASDARKASVFSRLRLGREKKIPFHAQLTPTDCGAASLSMALTYFGKETQIHAVRLQLGGGRNGVTAKQLLTAARNYGFRARGVQVDLNTLQYLTPGSILHWDLNHFVVYQRSDRKHLYIVDPAIGHRKLSLAEASKSLSGVAIVLEPSETFQTEKPERKSRYKRYRDWIFGVRGIWSRVLLSSFFLQLLALAVPALTGAIVDKVVPRADLQLLYLVGAGCLTMSSFYFLSTFLRGRLFLHLRTQIETKMSLDFVEHLFALPYTFFQQRTTGDLMMRLSSQAAIRELLTTGALSALLDGALVLVYFVLLVGAAPKLALVASVVALTQLVIVLFASKRNAELMTEGLATQSRLEAYQVEMLAGIETLKSMGAGPRATARWTDLYVDVLNTSLARGEFDITYSSLLGTLRFLGPIALLLTGAYQVLDGSLSLGIMLGLSALGSGFLEPVANLVTTTLKLSQLQSYMARLEDVLDSPVEPTRSDAVSRPLAGLIEVRELSFRYPSEQQPTLEGVTFEIQPGEAVAIVGASGSGKSTLARLLAGLYQPASGGVSYDGVQLAQMDLMRLRERLGIVTQDTRLFSGTLRDNVTLFEPTVPDTAVQRACELACLHADIARMPMGYDTMLADGGTSLSGGQRQRLSLARALLREPDILILDEATSALDTVTEQKVQHELRSLKCTRVLVAHRLSTIIESDKIVVLEAGRVVGVGKHADLLQRCAAYQNLIRAQHEPHASSVSVVPAAPAMPSVAATQMGMGPTPVAPVTAVAPAVTAPMATPLPPLPTPPSPASKPPLAVKPPSVRPPIPTVHDSLRARVASKPAAPQADHEPLELSRRKGA